MDRNRSQGQTGEIYNQQNAAYTNQQSMQQMQNAFESMNQNSYQIPASPYNNGQQKAGQLATPIYDGKNPFANIQAVSQAQLQALQTNIAQQKELRMMQSEGYTGVTEAIRLYRSFGKKNKSDFFDIADIAQGLPGLSSTVFAKRREQIRSKVGSAAGRVSGKYAGALSGEFRHESSARTAALQMGEQAFIDYMTGKIINQNYADPTLDSSMVETVARKRAIDLMDFYVNQLPKKRIENGRDLERLMRMADAVGGDIDIDTIGKTMQSFKQLGTEKALVDAQNNLLNEKVTGSRESALDLIYGNDQYDAPIEMDRELMGDQQVESISFLAGVGEGLVKGVAKEGGSLLNTIGVNLFGKSVAIGLDLVGSATTGEIQTGARDTIHAISDKLNQMVADGDPTAVESASRHAVKLFLAYTVGAAMLPTVGAATATAAGIGMMMAGSVGQSAVGAVTGAIGDMLFGTEENITPARELYDDISAVTAEGVALWGMNRAAQWTSSKGANLKDILSSTDSIKSIDPTVRGAILSAAEDVSAENMQKTFDSIQEMSVASGKIPVDKVEGYSRLMQQQDHLKDSAAMSRAVQEGVKEIGLNSLNEYAEKMGIDFLSESVPKKLNNSIRELSETMKDSYRNSIGKAFGKNPDGSEKMVRLSEILPKNTIMNLDLPKNGTARDALVNGVAKLGEEGIIDYKDAGKLARLIQNGKTPEAIDLINRIGEVSPVASHWLKSELGKGWIEGRDNRGVGELKREMRSILEDNMTKDQMAAYDIAQTEYSTYKDVLKLFRNHLDEMSGKQDVVALSNKFHEVKDALSNLQARLIGENRSSKMIRDLSELRDDIGLNAYHGSIDRRGKYTPEIINTIASKILPFMTNESYTTAIKTSADMMQNAAIRGTKSVGKSSTGTYRTSGWVSDLLSSWVLGKGNSGKGIVSSIYKRLFGSESGIGKEVALKMAQLSDIFINNPDIMELVKTILNDPVIKKSRVSTDRMIFGLRNHSENEEE